MDGGREGGLIDFVRSASKMRKKKKNINATDFLKTS